MNAELARLLLNLFRPYWLRFAEALLCMIFAAILAMPMPIVSIFIIDQIVINQQPQILHLICMGLLIIILMSIILNFLQKYLLLVFSRRIFFDLELRLFKAVMEFPMSYFNKASPRYIATRISEDVRQLRTLMAETYIEGLNSIVLLLIGSVIMLTIDPFLTLLVLLFTPIILISNVYLGRRIYTYSDRVQEYRGVTNSRRIESLNSLPVIRAFDRGHIETIKIAQALHRELDVKLSRDMYILSAGVLQGINYTLGSLLVLWLGGYKIISNEISIGQFLAFNALMSYVYNPISQLSAIYVNVQKGLGVLNRIYNLLMEPRETRRGRMKRVLKGHVVFKDLHFGYRPDLKVLDGINFCLEPGKITCITGSTGSGKSTVIKLLLRYYDHNSGQILIDGYEISQFDVQGLRGDIGYVEQDVRLVSGTIRSRLKTHDVVCI